MAFLPPGRIFHLNGRFSVMSYAPGPGFSLSSTSEYGAVEPSRTNNWLESTDVQAKVQYYYLLPSRTTYCCSHIRLQSTSI